MYAVVKRKSTYNIWQYKGKTQLVGKPPQWSLLDTGISKRNKMLKPGFIAR